MESKTKELEPLKVLAFNQNVTCEPEPPPTTVPDPDGLQFPKTEKHPEVRLIPPAKVEVAVAVIERTFDELTVMSSGIIPSVTPVTSPENRTSVRLTFRS